MPDALAVYPDPFILLPMAAMFFIIFAVVLRSLREMPLFKRGANVVLALCVTTLAMYGMEQTIVRAVVTEYNAPGVAMLFGLAGLLFDRLDRLGGQDPQAHPPLAGRH